MAKSRILKLKTLAKYDTISIIIKKGAIPRGTPDGKNKLEICHFCAIIPIRLIPIKCIKARKNVTIKELVMVNEYGIKPDKLAPNIKENKKNQIVKYEFRDKLVFE